MRRARPTPCQIEVLVEFGLWKEPGKMKALVRRAVGQAAAAISTSGAELAIVLTDDSAIRLLNRHWRGVDTATNVLAFPAASAGGERPLLGDIVLAHETVAREARAEGKPFVHHLAHLAVHGFLHLLGYDHQHEADAEAMEQAERDILRRLRIPDPYRPQPRIAAARTTQSTRTDRRMNARRQFELKNDSRR